MVLGKFELMKKMNGFMKIFCVEISFNNFFFIKILILLQKNKNNTKKQNQKNKKQTFRNQKKE